MKYFVLFAILLSIIFIFSQNHSFAETKFCPTDYSIYLERMDYNAGEQVVIKIESPYGHECVNQPTLISMKILDATKKPDGGNVVYEETREIVDNAEFYYQLPPSTSEYTPFRYLVEISFESSNETLKRERIFFAQDFAKTKTYDFQIWPFESEIPKGVWYAHIISKICPFFPSTDLGREVVIDYKTNEITDFGSSILMQYYFTSPLGLEMTTQELVDSNSDCNQMWARGIILPNETGTWSVYSTAKWIQEGSTKELKSKTVNFLVKEPVTTKGKITKLVDLGALKKMAFDNSEEAEQFWGSSSIFSSFNWVDNGSKIIFMTYQFSNKTWILNIDGKELKMLNGTEYQFKDRQLNPNRLGDIEVVVPSGYKTPVTTIFLRTIDGTYEQILHIGPPNPVVPAISPDGRYVVFGSDPDIYNPKDAPGVYLIELSTPVPEFPIAVLILVASMVTILIITRRKCNTIKV